ncbi:MAG: hypothetical protein ABIG08_01845, partial [bacterium]
YDPQIVFRTGGTAATSRFTIGVDHSDSNKFKIATSTLGTNDLFVIDPINGNIGIATSSPDRRFEVLENTASAPQMKLTSDAANFTEFYVDSTGDLSVSLTGSGGDDIIVLDENLKVCAGGSLGSISCPAFTLSGNGNLIVEGEVFVGGNTTDYIKFATSSIEYWGAARPKRSIILTAAGGIVPTGGATQTKVDGTNHSYYVLDYTDGVASSTYWHWIMPDSFATGTVDVTIYWETATTSGDVVWGIETAGIKTNSAEDVDSALGQTSTTTDTAQANANDLGSVTISNWANGTWDPEDYIIFRVYRDGTDSGDTMTDDARLVKVKIEYSAKEESD